MIRVPQVSSEPDPLLSVYQRLWRGAEADGAFVNYYGLTIAGESGYFHAREGEGRKPLIAIFRPHYVSDEKPSRGRNNGVDVTDDEMRAEIMTLAHEIGHFQSWLRAKNAGGDARAEWLIYQEVAVRRDDISQRILKGMARPFDAQLYYERLRAANQAELTDVDRGRIVSEETSAWRIGRERLEAIGYDDLDEYDRRATVGPLIYRYHLGMLPLEAIPEWARGLPVS